MIRVFRSSFIRELLPEHELNELVKDFRKYKESGRLPDYFGRDVPYDNPYTLNIVRQEEVRHLHLAEDGGWNIRMMQFKRTSDRHLVYCQGAIDDDHYLLITLLSPDAHEQANNNDVMFKLGEQAEVFRRKY